MYIQQVTVFLENKMGRLSEVMRTLSENDINIQAMSIADTADFGILRLIVNNPDKAMECIRANGFTVKAAEVVAVSLEHKPGGLANVLKTLEENKIFIEYLYDYTRQASRDNATIIFKLENSDESVELMRKAGIKIISPEELNTFA